MRQFNKIMVAVDFSAYSKAAAQHAFDLARELGATVIFIHVVNQRDINLIQHALAKILEGKEEEFSISEYIVSIHDDRQQKLDELIDAVNPEKLEYQVQIESGIPYQELLRAIGELEVDLVVMGVKGKSDIRDVTTGSTALKMFRRCPVPLVTVRDYKS